MARTKTFSAPRPEALHLPTILRRVESGDIRVPDFQRKYVWLEKQVIELLESVYKGYPIGSLLFWRAASSQLRYDAMRAYPMPVVEKAREPVSFLLDGQQRLSTLYGCLYLPPERRGEAGIFNVHFSLRERRFFHGDPDAPVEDAIPLWSLFSPLDFLAVQRELQSKKEGVKFLDESVELHSVFQEYMIPTVTLEKRRLNEVVEIFERVNRTGTKLSTVDFMRAVTWSAGFDLGKEIAGIERMVGLKSFPIRAETIVKTIAIALGIAPTPDAMLEMRELPSADMADGVLRARKMLSRAIAFLREELFVFSDAYVPYEGQLLVLTRAFANKKPAQLDAAALDWLKRWFLATSLNEALRGKPDHVVAGAVVEAGKLVDDDAPFLPTALRVNAADLLKRKLIRGKALSSGVIGIFALSQPRSVFSGDEFGAREFMSEFNADRFVPIVPLPQLQEALGVEFESPRVLANIAVIAAADVGRFNGYGVADDLCTRVRKVPSNASDLLASQIISQKAMEKLLDQDHTGFLKQRAKDIVSRAAKLVKEP